MQTESVYTYQDLSKLFLYYARKQDMNSNYGNKFQRMVTHNNINMCYMLDEMAKKEGKRAVYINHWKREDPTVFFMFLNDISELRNIYKICNATSRTYYNESRCEINYYRDIECESIDNPCYENTEIRVSYFGDYELCDKKNTDNNSNVEVTSSSNTSFKVDEKVIED